MHPAIRAAAGPPLPWRKTGKRAFGERLNNHVFAGIDRHRLIPQGPNKEEIGLVRMIEKLPTPVRR